MKYYLTKLVVSLGLIASSAYGQQINAATQLKNKVRTANGGTGTAPGTTLPATCGTGDIFVKTNAALAAQTYVCSTGNVWTIQSGGGSPAGYTTVTYSATPTFTASSTTGTSFLITLTGNVTSSTLAAASTGQVITMNICQDGAGSRTFVFPTTMLNAGTIDATASACTHQVFVFDGTNAQALAPAYVTGPAGGKITMPGSTSGSTVLQPAAISGSSVLTLPAATDTLVGKATTDTLTNKTLTSPAMTNAACTGTCTGFGGQTRSSGPGGFLWQIPTGFLHALDFSAWTSLKPVYWPVDQAYSSQTITKITVRLITGDAGKKIIGFFMDKSKNLICQSATASATAAINLDLVFAPCVITDPNPYFALCTNSTVIVLYDLDSGSFGGSAALSGGEGFGYNNTGTGANACTISVGVITAPSSIGALTTDNAAYHPWAYVHP